jgi:hypothetical protein
VPIGKLDAMTKSIQPAKSKKRHNSRRAMLRKKDFGKNFDDEVKTLRILRHSVRVILEISRVHSDEWDKLEAHLYAVENAARDRSAASRPPVRAAIKSLESFSASLRPNWAHVP